jgi:hypothetical protein
MGKINNVIRIPTSLDTTFFSYWIDFLRPLHNLTDRESSLLASILKSRYQLSKKISDTELLDKILFSEEIKKEIRQDCNMSNQYFQVMVSKLKKVGILSSENRVNPKIIPHISEDENSVQLLLNFEMKK